MSDDNDWRGNASWRSEKQPQVVPLANHITLKHAFNDLYDAAMKALDSTHPLVPLKGDAGEALDHLMAMLTVHGKQRKP